MTEHESQLINESLQNTNNQVFGLYSIKDLKTNSYTPPFIAKTDEDATRQFDNIVNYSNSLMNKFPDDYQLWYVGTFDMSQGIIISSLASLVVNANELVREDTIKYDELKKETKTIQFQVQNICKEFDEKSALYEKKLRELTLLEDKIKEKYSKSDVDLFPCPPKDAKKLHLKKRTLINKLFGD